MTQMLKKIRGSELIVTSLREAIITGQLPPGGKILPTKTLSEEYGVASNTAQKALSELADEGLIRRRKGKGTYVSDYKNLHHKSGRVSLILPSDKHLWPELSYNLAREIHQIGLNTSLYDHSQVVPHKKQTNYSELDRVIAEKPMTVITVNMAMVEYLAKKLPDCRIIAIASVLAPEFRGDVVFYDAYLTAYLGTRHLIESGYTRIGCVYNLKPADQNQALAGESDLLLMGYRRALVEAGLKETHVICPTLLEKSGQTMEDYFEKNAFPEAFYCSNDHRAVGVVKAAKKFGKTVPDDLALVGTHNTPWADAFDLTSFDTRMEMVAMECAKLIKASMESQQDGNSRTVVQVPPKIVIRKSCGCKL